MSLPYEHDSNFRRESFLRAAVSPRVETIQALVLNATRIGVYLAAKDLAAVRTHTPVENREAAAAAELCAAGVVDGVVVRVVLAVAPVCELGGSAPAAAPDTCVPWCR